MAERVFNLPDLGEGLEDAEIVEWKVAEGDTVALNQPLVEVNTAKALVEIPSPVAGVVTSLHGQAGDVVKVGAPLVTFAVEGEEPTEAPAAAGADEPEEGTGRGRRGRPRAGDGVGRSDPFGRCSGHPGGAEARPRARHRPGLGQRYGPGRKDHSR